MHYIFITVGASALILSAIAVAGVAIVIGGTIPITIIYLSCCLDGNHRE